MTILPARIEITDPDPDEPTAHFRLLDADTGEDVTDLVIMLEASPGIRSVRVEFYLKDGDTEVVLYSGSDVVRGGDFADPPLTAEDVDRQAALDRAARARENGPRISTS